ncbi:hypothetical protein MDAP_000488 [Mitosporidium daphniae]
MSSTADEYFTLLPSLITLFFSQKIRELYISLRWLHLFPAIVIEYVYAMEDFPNSTLKQFPFFLDPFIPALTLLIFKLLTILCRYAASNLNPNNVFASGTAVLERSHIFFLITVVFPFWISFCLFYFGILECGVLIYQLQVLPCYWMCSVACLPSFIKVPLVMPFLLLIPYTPYTCPFFERHTYSKKLPRIFILSPDGKLPEPKEATPKYRSSKIVPLKILPKYISGVPERFNFIILLPSSRESIFSPLLERRDLILKNLWENLPHDFVDVPGKFSGFSSEESKLKKYWSWKKDAEKAISEHRSFVKSQLEHNSEMQQADIRNYLQDIGLKMVKEPFLLTSESISKSRNIFASSWSTNAIFCFNVDYDPNILSYLSKIKFCKILVEPVVKSGTKSSEELSIIYGQTKAENDPSKEERSQPFYSEYFPNNEKNNLLQSMVQKNVVISSNLRNWGFDKAWKWSTGWEVTCSFYDSGASLLPNGVLETYRGRWPNGKMNGPSKTIDHKYSWYDFVGESPYWPCDLEGHGTAVISSFCGASKEDNLITGVAPDALWIMFDGLSELRRLQDSEIIDDIYSLVQFTEWSIAPRNSVDHGVRITSSSLVSLVQFEMEGKEALFYSELQEWMYTVFDACAITSFIASGNYGEWLSFVPAFSQSSRKVITIGSAFFDRKLQMYLPSQWSSYGSMLDFTSSKVSPDFLAPGTNVIVSNAYSIPGNGASLYFANGTSFASPSAAGVAALLLAIDPTLTNKEIYEILKITAIKPFSSEDSLENAAKFFTIFSSILETSEKYLFDNIVINPKTKLPYLVYPNIFYGYGVINATAAVLLTRELLNTQSRIEFK